MLPFKYYIFIYLKNLILLKIMQQSEVQVCNQNLVTGLKDYSQMDVPDPNCCWPEPCYWLIICRCWKWFQCIACTWRCRCWTRMKRGISKFALKRISALLGLGSVISNVYMFAKGPDENVPRLINIGVGVTKFFVDIIKEQADLPSGGNEKKNQMDPVELYKSSLVKSITSQKELLAQLVQLNDKVDHNKKETLQLIRSLVMKQLDITNEKLEIFKGKKADSQNERNQQHVMRQRSDNENDVYFRQENQNQKKNQLQKDTSLGDIPMNLTIDNIKKGVEEVSINPDLQA